MTECGSLKTSETWGFYLATALCLIGLGACSSGKKGSGSSLTGNGGAGGSGGASGSGLCLSIGCPDGSAQISGQLGEQCVSDCGGERPASSVQLATSWTRVGESAGDWTLFMSGDGTLVDGQPTPVTYAVYRIGKQGGPLDGHWVCATAGTLTPYAFSTDNPMPQPFKLTGLTDMGICQGDDTNQDALTLELDGSLSSVTGTAMGQAISLQGRDPFCTEFDCSLDVATDSPLAGSYFSTFSEKNDTGTPVPLTDAIWVAPKSLGMDVICGSASSTVTRSPTDSFDMAHIEMHGLKALHCPGTALTGELDGSL